MAASRNRNLSRVYSRRNVLRGGLIGGAGVAAATLIGCSSDEPVDVVQPNPTEAAEAPREGGLVSISGSREPTVWDPVLSEASPPATYAAPLFPHLYVVKITPETNGNEFEFEEDFAAGLEQPDGTTYVFKIRPNGKWGPHPALNGRKITAEDVAYSLERLRSKQSVISANYGPVDRIEAVDSETVKVTLKHPFSPFVAYLSDTSAIIAPPEVTETLSELNTAQQVHGGPWTLGSYERGVKVSYKRNPNYYLWPVPYLDLDIIIQFNSSTAEIAFESRQIITRGVSARELQRLRGSHPELRTGSSGGAHQSIFFNTSKAPWNDVRVRKAIQKSIDFELYRRIRFPDNESRLETPARAWLSPYALPQQDLAELYKPDPAEAKRLLTAAGFADGLDGGELLAYPGGASEVEIVSPVVEQLKAVNVKFEIGQVEFSDHQKKMKDGDYDTGAFIYSRRYPEVDQYLWPRLHSAGPLNYSRGKDSNTDRQLDAQREELDNQKRISLLHDIQKNFIKDQHWMIVLPTSEGLAVWWPELRNYNEHVSFGQYQFRRAWLSQ